MEHMGYDLHLHTYWSYDASTNPERYFQRARELGVRCLAITDHHVLDSLDEVQAIALSYPEVRHIPSAELTVTTSRGSVDLLCYGFPAQGMPEELQGVLRAYREWQREAGAARSRGMLALGHDFSDAHRLDLLRSYRPTKAIDLHGNTHVKNQVLCDYFVARGFISSQKEYAPLMKRVQEKAPFPPYPHVTDVVPVVKQVGALVAIAHPFGYFRGHDVVVMDGLRDECSLDGIECANGKKVPPDHVQLYRQYCQRHGLFSTAGSDCHADEDVDEVFALCRGFEGYRGGEAWLDELLSRLRSPS